MSFFEDPLTIKIVSVIIGLGLATMLKQTCKSGRCVVIKGPKSELIKDKVFKIEGECYKYVHPTDC